MTGLLAGRFDTASLGMYYCVNCCDDKVNEDLAEQIARQTVANPFMAAIPLMEFHLGEFIIPLCAAWGAREPGPSEYEPVRSDIPTLILAGEYDQNTPSHWGRLAGETLTRQLLRRVSSHRTRRGRSRPVRGAGDRQLRSRSGSSARYGLRRGDSASGFCIPRQAFVVICRVPTLA